MKPEELEASGSMQNLQSVESEMSQGPKMKSLENQLLKGSQGRGSPEGNRQRMTERCSVHYKKCRITETWGAELKEVKQCFKDRDVMNSP